MEMLRVKGLTWSVKYQEKGKDREKEMYDIRPVIQKTRLYPKF